MMKAKNNRVSLFLVIALGWSFLWFSQRYRLNELFDTLPSTVVLFFGLVPTLGLVVASGIVGRQLSSNKMSFVGGNRRLSVGIMLIPLFALSGAGISNSYGIQENVFGFLIGAFTMAYALFEEIGWRGYLNAEFEEGNKKWFGYVFIGFIWYVWHWYFLREGSSPNWLMIPILIAASFGIGEVARKTRSILVCAAIHSLANMLVIYPVIAQNISLLEKLVVLGTCLVIWIPAIKKLEEITSTIEGRPNESN